MAKSDPKCTPAQRDEIYARYETGEPVTQIALAYSVDESTIRKYISTRRVKSQNKQQTYRENLNWALSAAGEFLRTNVKPTVCPNDAAWFLYQQATTEPKDFMAKVAQVEKGDDGDDDKKIRRAAQRSIIEIEKMLSSLDAEG